jgi:hypothetical protein
LLINHFFCSLETVSVQSAVKLAKGGYLILGQKQDSMETSGFFAKSQAFSGKMSQFEIWDKELSEEVIKGVASCQSETSEEQHRTITWSSNDWETSNVELAEDTLDSFCAAVPLDDRLIWLEQVSYAQIKETCDKLDGELPILNSMEDASKISMLQAEGKSIFEALYESDALLDRCIIKKSKAMFWLGQNKINQSWVNPYDQFMPFDKFKMEADDKTDCAYVVGDSIKAGGCRSWYPCAHCKLPPKTVVHLKGLCSSDIEWYYDTKYYPYGTIGGKPHFKGTMKSHIYYNATNEKWYLASLRHPTKYISTIVKMPFDVPFGTHKWYLETENSLCSKHEGHIQELTYSKCFPNKYTCNSGKCIPLR